VALNLGAATPAVALLLHGIILANYQLTRRAQRAQRARRAEKTFCEKKIQ
jgi:hypothetical protein